MRQYNLNELLKIIYRKTSISKSELSAITQLSIPAVSSLMDLLIEQQFVIPADRTYNQRGKHAGYFTVNPSRENIACLLVSPERVRGVVANYKARAVTDEVKVHESFQTPEQLLAGIEKTLAALQSTGVEFGKTAIGLHGVVDQTNGTSVFMPQAPWKKEVDIVGRLERTTGLQVMITNDVVVRAYAEKWLGKGFLNDSFVLVNLDYGIGAAIVNEGKIYIGRDFAAGQIGHLAVQENGRKCSCGFFGCIETIASAKALMQDYKIAKKKDAQQNPGQETADLDALTVTDLVNDANNGDRQAIATLHHAGYYLGIAIKNLVATFNPEKIYFTGALAHDNTHLTAEVEKIVQGNLSYHIGHDSPQKPRLINVSTLSKAQQLLGASFLWIEKDFEL